MVKSASTVNLGKGSTFWFELSLPVNLPTSLSPNSKLSGVSVLLIDDNPINLALYKKRLDRYVMQVDTAGTHQEIMQRLHSAGHKKTPYQVILLDQEMHLEHGEALSETIIGMAQCRDTALILMTSSGQKADLEQVRALGISAQLRKPTASELLYCTLQDVLAVDRVHARQTTPLAISQRAIPQGASVNPEEHPFKPRSNSAGT